MLQENLSVDVKGKTQTYLPWAQVVLTWEGGGPGGGPWCKEEKNRCSVHRMKTEGREEKWTLGALRG